MEKVTVEYYRMWHHHTWDTDTIEIELTDGEDTDLDAAVGIACQAVDWKEEAPAMVGFYAFGDEDEGT